MIQGGSGLGFAAEATERLRVFGDIVGQKFKRDKAVQARVLSLVNHAHASAPELLEDAVMGNGLSDERGGICHLPLILGGGGKRVNEAGFVTFQLFLRLRMTWLPF
jgi:hypothetical protein